MQSCRADRCFVALLCLSFFFAARFAQALNLLWDGTGTTWNSVTPWSLISNATTPNPAARPGAADIASFNIETVNTAQTVNLDAVQSALGLNFSSTGTVLIQSAAGGGSANTLSLGTSGITVNAGAGADTITAPVSLTGAQSWVNNSGNPLSVNGNIATNGNNLTFAVTSNIFVGGVLSGAGGLIKNGAGTVTLNNNNAFTGGVTINAGNLLIGNTGALNSANPNALMFGPSSTGTLSLTGNNVTVASLSTNATPGSPIIQNAGSTPATLTINSSGSSTFAGTLQDGFIGGTALLLTKNGAGTLLLSGANTYNGLTNLNAGTLRLGSNQALGSAAGGTVVSGGATLDLNGQVLTGEAITFDTNGILANSGSSESFATGLISPLNVATSSSFIVNGVGNITLNGGIAVNAGLILTKNGTNTLTLAGTADNYALGLSVNSGTIQLAKTNSGFNNHATDRVTIAGGTVRLSGSGDDQIYDFGYPVTVSSGTFDMNGHNETVNGMYLQGSGVGGAGALVNSASAAATLIANTPFPFPDPINGIVLTGNASIGVTQSTGSLTLNDVINGNFALTKVGAGTLSLGGANTFSGGITVAQGTLVQTGGVLPSGVTNQGTFVYNSGTFAGQLVNQGSAIFNSNFTAGGGLVNHTSVSAGPGFTFTLNGAGLNNLGSFVVESGGNLNATTISNSGELVLAGTVQATSLANSGLIRSSGEINANVTNLPSGDVRIIAGENLRVVGSSFNNQGLIEVIGTSENRAEIEFNAPVTNVASTGSIAGRNNVLRFNQGLANSGSVAISIGLSDVFGDITNSAGGTVVVSGGAGTTFYDDIVQNGTFRVSKVGSTTSVAVIFGAFSGSGGSTGGGDIFFEGDLRPGNSPATVSFNNNIALGSGARLTLELGGTTPGLHFDQVLVTGELALDGALEVALINSFAPALGNSFNFLDWATRSGSFSTIELPELATGLIWNTSQLYSDGIISVAAAGLPGDYNQNGIVDAGDYTVWRDNLGSGAALPNDDTAGVGPDDYARWKTHFGQSAGSGASAMANVAVPEPATLALLFLATAGICLRGRHFA